MRKFEAAHLGLTAKKKNLFPGFSSADRRRRSSVLATNSAYSTQFVFPFLKRFHPDLVFTRCSVNLIFSGHLWPLAFLPFLVATAIVISGFFQRREPDGRADGLAIGCTVIAAGALTVLTYGSSNYRWATYLEIQYIRASASSLICGALVGASLGFSL